jgi:hypothetical protein
MDVEFSVRPASAWRFIPVFGQWRMFRLGQRLPFHVTAQTKRIDGPHKKNVTIRLSVFISEHPTHQDVLEFNFDGEVGQKVSQRTDPFFLRPTGDAVLKGIPPGPFRDDLYTFQVEETVYKAGVAIIAFITALIGAGLGAFLTKLWMD